MAKASTTTPGKMKSAPRAAAGKQRSATAAAKRKAAAATAAAKPGAPKMAPASSKAPAKAAPAKISAAKGKNPAAKAKTPAAKAKIPPAKAKSPPAKAKSSPAKAKTAAGHKPALKPAAKQQAAPRSAVPAKVGSKTVAVKTAAGRRPASRTAVPAPPPRRTRSIAAPRKVRTPAHKLPTTARKAAASASASIGKRNAPQSFTVSHLDQEDFKPDGLRAYARYRDLGIAAATGGLCQAHVIRFNPPCTDEVRKPHAHDVDLQLVYVLQGWMKNEFDGHGTQMMSAGSCWLQPRGIRHTVLDYSPDCEVLEIIVPADFKTQQL